MTLEAYEAHLAAEAAAHEAEWRARQDRQAAKAAAKEKLLADFELEWA